MYYHLILYTYACCSYKRGTGRIANEENNADHELQNITTPSTENEPSPPVDTNEDDTTAYVIYRLCYNIREYSILYILSGHQLKYMEVSQFNTLPC